MRKVYSLVLGFSSVVTLLFGLGFLLAPQALFKAAGVVWQAPLVSASINLGTLVLFCSALSAQALWWIRAGNPAGYRLADLLGLMLLLMGALEGAHGLWIPLAGDGGRGALLVGLRLMRSRRGVAVVR
jgi:hypothetical protein